MTHWILWLSHDHVAVDMVEPLELECGMVKGRLEELDVSHSWDDDILFEERGCSVAAPSAL